METIRNIILIPELILLIYLGFATVYFFVFAFASLLYREVKKEGSTKRFKILVLIPAYKEDEVIIETVKSAVQHKSNRSLIEILVIADSLKNETLEELTNTGIKVLPVSFPKSTKVKSINKALKKIKTDYDYALVLDADNHMEKECIDHLITILEQGYRIVQGHRTAKNHNTNFAVLDGISEEVNNSIFRKGHSRLGLSASLIGSGFICEFNLFRDLMQSSVAVGGFDKEIELKIIEQNIRIGYAQNALVYDEKVQQADAFINQRRRWLSAQYIYFRQNITKGFVQLFKYGNIDYFDKLMQFLVPPRIIALGLSYLISSSYLILLLVWGTLDHVELFFAWSGIALLTSLAIMLSIPAKKFGTHLLKSIWTLPLGFLITLIALFKTSGANKSFIHTPHGIIKK